MATNLTIDEVTQNVTLVVSNERGPAGPAGPNSVTSATTSDGTANLSLASATVTGTLTASHIHGNLAGSVYMHVRAGEALSKGDPVYVSGSHGTGASMVPIVSRADASNAAKMPAIAIMDAAVANNGDGHAVINGTISDLDTSAYSVNATLYVDNGGGMTATKPANAQPVARVERSNLNNGGIVVKVNGLYSDVTIASSQVTDATSLATPNTIVKRDGGGSAIFHNVTADTFDGNADPAVVKLGGSSNFLEISDDGVIPIAYFQCNALPTGARTYTFPDATGTVILDSTLGAGVNGLSTITGAKSFSGQVSLTGQAATDANSAMTRGLADARYDQVLLKISREFSGRAISERQISSMTTTGTSATVTCSNTIAQSCAGQLIVLHTMNPSALNGLYLCTAHTAGSAVMTITTTKTNTFVSGRFSNAAPIAKITKTGTDAAKLNGNVFAWYGAPASFILNNEILRLGCCPIFAEKIGGSGNFSTIGVDNPSFQSTFIGNNDRLAFLVLAALDGISSASEAYLCICRPNYTSASNGVLRRINGSIIGELIGSGMTIENTTDY